MTCYTRGISTPLCFFYILTSWIAHAQHIIMQGWYWDYPKTAQGKWWVDTLAQKAHELAAAGITHLWLPPMSKTASGSNSNGYDIRDYFDLGIPPTSTQFGNEVRIRSLIDSLKKYNVAAVADMIYNHRSGGAWENNPSVEGWIENYNLTKHNNGDACYPSDRFRCILPIGGNTNLGSGTYYFKIRSASQSSSFFGKPYQFRVTTKKVATTNLPNLTESEPNGGADCGQGNNYYGLARIMKATVDAGGCGTDEFYLNLTANDFHATGDTLFITLTNESGQYSDHFIYGLWYSATNSDIQHKLVYQTATNFYGLKSGRGGMNHTAFKPNGNPTCLCGDWDSMLFYYDIDQNVTSAADTLRVWTRWLMEEFGIHGLRIDAVKHFPPAFTGDLLDYLHTHGLQPSLVVGESYDYDAGILRSRLDEVYAHMDQSTKNAMYYALFDFNLQSCLRDACDQFGYDVRNVFQCGMHSQHNVYRRNIVTFVNNHDFREAYQSVDTDPILAYAYILTNPVVGMPCIYWSDFYSKKYPNYTDQFYALLNAHYKFIQGAQHVDYLNRIGTPYAITYQSGQPHTTLLYQLSGATGTCLPDRDVVVAINFSGQPLKLTATINTQNPFKIKPGDTLSDVLGLSAFDYVIVTSNGQITLEVPARSYSVWARVPPVKQVPVIQALGPTEFCFGQSVVLSLTTTPVPCYDYRWRKDGQLIAGATSTSLVVNESGVYTLEASYNGAQAITSAAITVTAHPEKPVILSDGITLSCSVPNVAYQWLSGMSAGALTPIPGATAQTYVPTASAFYAVLIQDSAGCTRLSDPLQFWMAHSPADPANDWQVYPLPADEKIYVDWFNGPVDRLVLENLQGMILVNKVPVYKGQPIEIDIAHLPAGIYLLRLQAHGTQRVHKLVKK